ncbi:MAG TPA: hypothetical protein VKA30_05865, partial [Actinomycetota bacterium]|nr:hypothetical protein [Actinomycetota bacterium]
MRHRAATAWGLAIAGLALVAATFVLIVVAQPTRAYPAWFVLGSIAVVELLLGGLIWSRRPEERLGWILVIHGLLTAVTLFTGEYATVAALGPGHLPYAQWTAWVSSVAQTFTIVGLVVLMFLFPTGRPLTPRWRLVGWGLGTGVFALMDTVVHGPMLDSNIDYIRNPLWI